MSGTDKVKPASLSAGEYSHFGMDLAPSGFSPLNFLALACANSDLGFALLRDCQFCRRFSMCVQNSGNLLAGMLIPQRVDLRRAGTHNVV